MNAIATHVSEKRALPEWASRGCSRKTTPITNIAAAMSRLLDFIGGHWQVSIIGMCKNAGKTTVLNSLIAECDASGQSIALCSVGRDGEKTDVITNKEKPRIHIRKGTLFASTRGLLQLNEVEYETLLATGIGTALGEAVVLRAVGSGLIELSGPSMNAQLPALIGFFFENGADRVLIDGAVSRKASASPIVAGCCILCTGADYDPDMSKVVADTAHVARIFRTPALPGNQAAANIVHLPGAITDSRIESLLSSIPKNRELWLVADNASKLMVSQDAYKRAMSRGCMFYVNDPVDLACICVNPHNTMGPGFDSERFLQEMRESADVPVVDVKKEVKSHFGT